MIEQNLSKLSPDEVSFLYNINVLEVKKKYDDKVKEIRIKFIKEKINGISNMTYIPFKNVCYVCGYKIKKSETPKTWYSVCSSTCAKNKPVYILNIEREFNSDIATIFKVAFSMLNKLSAVESVFDINRKGVEFIIRNFVKSLGKQFTEMGTNKDLFNKKKTVSSICIKGMKRIKNNMVQFGKSRYTLKPLYKQLI
jgi:hypothetical protein